MTKKPILTPKGIATICAIDSGLLPKVDGGWDDTAFNKFWEQFEKVMIEQGYSIIHDSFLDSIQKSSRRKLLRRSLKKPKHKY
mgnify:CR=1 FL=1